MTKEKDNMVLWNKVEKTNPSSTKEVSLGERSFTTINAQHQIMKATEMFGEYGATWGLKEVGYEYIRDLDESQVLCVGKAIFFHPNGEFSIGSSVFIQRKCRFGLFVDDDFIKKVDTDMTTKGLSKLGFNADIFLGKWDNNKYVMEQEKREKDEVGTKPKAENKRSPVSAQRTPETSKPTPQERKTSEIADKIGGTVTNQANKSAATERQIAIVKKIMKSTNLSNSVKEEFNNKLIKGLLTFKDADHVMNVLGKRAKQVKKIVEEARKLKVVDDVSAEKLRGGLTNLVQEDIDGVNDLTHAKLVELVTLVVE